MKASGDLTLGENWQLVVRHKALVLAFPVVAIVVASLAMYPLYPRQSQWRAEALVRTEDMGQPGGDTSILNFVASLDWGKTFATLGKKDRLLYRKTLHITPLKGNMVRITVTGYSREEAKDFAEGTADRIIGHQKGLFRNALEHLQSRIDRAQNQLRRLQDLQKNLLRIALKKGRSSPGTEGGLIPAASFGKTIFDIEDEAFRIEDTLDSYNEKAKAFKGQMASLSLVSMRENPLALAASTKIQIVEASGLLGLLLGVGAAFLVSSFRKAEVPHGKTAES